MTSTMKRVPRHTSQKVNERIRKDTLRSIDSAEGSSVESDKRLKKLADEWDIERAIEANASTLMIVGLALGVFANKKYLILPAAVGGFLLQHAIQGWCPPVPVLRRLGFRTSHEINSERFILKLRRGDISKEKSSDELLEAALT